MFYLGRGVKKSSFVTILKVILIIFVVSCGSASNEQSNDVGLEQLKGRVVDGPVVGSSCFVDFNGNHQREAAEPLAISDANGYYTISFKNVSETINVSKQTLVCLGGTDRVTQQTISFPLKTILPETLDENTNVQITPITTLLSGVSSEVGKKKLLDNLDIDMGQLPVTEFYTI